MKKVILIIGLLIVLIIISGCQNVPLCSPYLDGTHIEGDGTIDTAKEINDYCNVRLEFQEGFIRDECNC